MSRPLLVLRPEPGAAVTAARAAALGQGAVTVPLFEIVAIDWEAPAAARFEALMVTSANAIRHAGAALSLYQALPVYAVGEATAEAARGAGFPDVRSGPGDAAGLTVMLAHDGISRALHLCGEDRREAEAAGLSIKRVPVYAAWAIECPQGLAEAIARKPVALLHSPRAAARFAELVTDRHDVAIAAISADAARAAGAGWAEVAVAEASTDQALLALAARMCKQEMGKTRDGCE